MDDGGEVDGELRKRDKEGERGMKIATRGYEDIDEEEGKDVEGWTRMWSNAT